MSRIDVPKLLLAASAAFATAFSLPAAAQGPVGGAPIFGAPASGALNLTGKWINAAPMAALKTDKGAAPPLNAKGRALYAKRKADPNSDPIKACQMQGEPRLLYTAYPFLILQYDKHVDFIHSVNHTYRIVYFGAKDSPEADPQWLGHPVASLDGKSLVIDSENFNDKTWLDYSGLPHGTKLKTRETYALSEDGQTINGTVTIDDPEFYSRPWTTPFTLKRAAGTNLEQFVCLDDHKM